jgi:hypothetical protein
MVADSAICWQREIEGSQFLVMRVKMVLMGTRDSEKLSLKIDNELIVGSNAGVSPNGS